MKNYLIKLTPLSFLLFCLTLSSSVLSFYIFKNFLFGKIFSIASVIFFLFYSLHLFLDIYLNILKKEKIFFICIILLFFSLIYFFSDQNIRGDYDAGNYKIAATALDSNKISPLFLPGYPVFLYPFYKLFGLNGFSIGNSFLFLLSMLIINTIYNLLIGKRKFLIEVILWAVFYPTIWFYRQTLAENLSLPLFLISTLSLLKIQKKQNVYLNFLVGFFSISLSVLIRPEAILFFISYIITSVFLFYKNKYFLKNRIINLIFISFLFSIFIFSINIYYEYIYSTEYILKYIKKIPIEILKTFNFGEVSDKEVSFSDYPNYLDYSIRYTIDSIIAYGFLPIILLFTQIPFKKWKNLLFLLFLIPGFIFFKYPTISWTQPWFLRHIWMIVLPGLFLIGLYGFSFMKNNKRRCVLLSLLLFNLSIYSLNIIFLKEYPNFFNTLRSISNNIDDNSEVIYFGPNSKMISHSLYYTFNKGKTFFYYSEAGEIGEKNSKIYHEKVNNILENSSGEEKKYLISNTKLDSESYLFNKKLKLNFVDHISEKILILNPLKDANNYVDSAQYNPPKKLDFGYEPIRKSILKLPPKDTAEIKADFYIYEINSVGVI